MHTQSAKIKSSAGVVSRFARTCMLGEANVVRHLKLLGVCRWMAASRYVHIGHA